MKTILLFIFFLTCSVTLPAQLITTPVCPPFDIDLLSGMVNKNILPVSTIGQIKHKFPCFSSVDEEGTNAKCGAGVFFKDRDVYFYTDRDYIEIGPAFKGKLSIPLMGAARNSLFKWLGDPQMKDAGWDAFQTAYGIIILYYNSSSRVDKIRFSTQTVNTIKICQ